MRFFPVLLLPFVAFSMPCLQVDGDRITAADIAHRAPGFERLDPALFLGFTPFPGSRRTFTSGQLSVLARENGLSLQGIPPDVCVERTLAPLTVDRMRSAMESSLGFSDARIEIIDFLRQPVPTGKLEFPRGGLIAPPTAAPETSLFWRGTINYGSRHTFAVWATVHISKELRVVLAAHQIRRGAEITIADIEVSNRNIYPFAPHFETQSDVLGRVARKTIPAGTVLTDSLVEIPPDVARGDAVHVVVSQGSARITFDAVAQSSGRKGDRIVLQNPQSLKTFRAVVDAAGRAHIGEGS